MKCITTNSKNGRPSSVDIIHSAIDVLYLVYNCKIDLLIQ